MKNDTLFLTIRLFWGVVDLLTALYLWLVAGWATAAIGFGVLSFVCLGMALHYILQNRTINK